MTNLEYTITETVRRAHGQIVEVDYDYHEKKIETVEENMQEREEVLEKKYRATIKRDKYNEIASRIRPSRNVLPYDSFVKVVRPFMMGDYTAQELADAFSALDTDARKRIDINKLAAFVPVLHPTMSEKTLFEFMHKVSVDCEHEINFQQFVDMILEGFARDIVCGHI